MNYPPPQPQPPLRPVNKGSGCLKVVAILGVILLIIGGIGGFVVYRIVSSPEGQKAVSLIGEGAKVTMDAMNAPGTKELKGIGCTQASVMDLARLEALGKMMDADAGSGSKGITKEAKLMVTCPIPKRTESPPTCDAVAGTYVTAVGGQATGPFIVVVQAQGDSTPKCSVLYAPNANRIREWRE